MVTETCLTQKSLPTVAVSFTLRVSQRPAFLTVFLGISHKEASVRDQSWRGRKMKPPLADPGQFWSLCVCSAAGRRWKGRMLPAWWFSKVTGLW